MANGESILLRWWPIIVFFLLQTAAAGVMYGDLRAQLATMRETQRIMVDRQKDFLTRTEYELLAEIEHLKQEARK